MFALKLNKSRGKPPRKHYRMRAIALTGLIVVFGFWSTPVRPQEAEAEAEEAATEEVVTPPEADPETAITTQEPDIPVEELKLLVQPLTLTELESEAAAWLILLKSKAQEISEAEIAIKRQNVSIDKQEEAASQLEEAQKALAEAEEAQKNAEEGSPEAEEAAKKLEEAKDNLQEAEEAVGEAVEAEERLEEDQASSSVLEQAEEAGELKKAEEALKEAEKARDDLEAGSSEYEAATEKIDALEAAIKDFEEAREVQEGTVPDSPEYEKATEELKAPFEAMKKAREAIEGKDAPEESEEQSSDKVEDLAATLQDTEVDADGDVKVAVDPDAADLEGNLEGQEEQLEEAAEELEENAEEDSEEKNELVIAVTELQEERTAVIDRFNVVLDELEKKGGDVEFYRKYIQAVSSIELDLEDTEGLGLRLVNWFQSDEGGMRWVNHIGVFLGVFIGFIILSQLLGMILNQGLSRFSNISQLLRNFLVMLVKRGGIVVGFLIALTALEVSLGPIIALLGGASFVLAFALQSNLGNLASGLMLLAYKPFDVGDEVIVNELWGYVKSISLASTQIQGFQAQIYTVPNNTIWGSTIENLTSDKVRKGSIGVRLSFDTNFRKTKEILKEIANAHPLTLEEKPAGIFPFKGGDYYTSLGVSFWTKTEDFWYAYDDILCDIQERFAKEGISILPEQNLRIRNVSDEEAPKLISQTPEESVNGDTHKSQPGNGEGMDDVDQSFGVEPSIDVEPS